MVFWPADRMGQYRVNDHRYHAPQFIFSVLDHKSADSISPSGVVSITPNKDLKSKSKNSPEVSTHIMNLLNMNITVHVHS